MKLRRCRRLMIPQIWRRNLQATRTRKQGVEGRLKASPFLKNRVRARNRDSRKPFPKEFRHMRGRRQSSRQRKCFPRKFSHRESALSLRREHVDGSTQWKVVRHSGAIVGNPQERYFRPRFPNPPICARVAIPHFYGVCRASWARPQPYSA